MLQFLLSVHQAEGIRSIVICPGRKTCFGNGCFQILSTLVLSTFISIPYHLPISISLSNMPCSNGSSLTSSTRSSAHFTVSSYFEVSKPFKGFLGKAFAVQVEDNRRQTAFLSNSSANLQNFVSPGSSFGLNTLIHVLEQFVDQSSFAQFSTSSLYGLH